MQQTQQWNGVRGYSPSASIAYGTFNRTQVSARPSSIPLKSQFPRQLDQEQYDGNGPSDKDPSGTDTLELALSS